MKRTGIILLLAILSGACHSGNGDFSNKDQIMQSFPVLIDSTGSDGLNLSKETENTTWLTTAQYEIYHIGLVKYTLFFNPFINSPPAPIPEDTDQQNGVNSEMAASPFEKYYIDWLEEVDYPYAEEGHIQIRVDSSKTSYNAYPVWVTNIETDTILIGYGTLIPLVMEAIDSVGNWKPIQEPFIYFCGVGLNSIFLPPSESVLTFAPVFKGDFKTKLRMSLGESHSDPFDGFINYRQFESIYNEDGYYKFEYKQELKE